jgi:phosphoribosylformylglycinamidine synthase
MSSRWCVSLPRWICADVALQQAVIDVLAHPTVASKRFLVTIGDRTVGGLTHRDQMVGPWQVPVADCAVTLADFKGFAGEAMAMGERTPLATVNAPASGRMAVAESITNLLAAPIELERVKLSANWMAACGEPGEDAALYETVKAVGLALCPALGISIPVGKDSLSMRTQWKDGDQAKKVTSPVSLIVTAFATLSDVRGTLTPQLNASDDTSLILIDLGRGQNRLGGSILAQTLGQMGDTVPDLDQPQDLVNLVKAINQLRARGAAAGLPRSQRRRPGGSGLRNGFCRPCGREPECRHAGDRGRWHCRQPHGRGRQQELGGTGQCPA